VKQFISHLAVEGRVSASTQNQALCAILFLYRDALQVELPFVEGIESGRCPRRASLSWMPSPPSPRSGARAEAYTACAV